MPAIVTDEELARRLGEPLERVRDWLVLGLLGQEEPRGALALARGRLIQYLGRHGVSLERIAEAFAGDLAHSVARYLEHRHPPDDPPVFDLGEAAERAALPMATARKLIDAIGLLDGGDFLNLEDVSVLRWWGTAIDAGMTEEATLQLLRVYRDALGRLGEAEIRLFHFYVHERLRAAGLTGDALATETARRAERLLPMIEPSLRYFHRLAFAAAEREDMLLHIGATAASVDTPAQLVVGIVFADLSSFTPLTEAMGDEAAIHVVRRFAELAHDAAARWSGRVVKQIGDAVMLVFFDTQAAVSFALDVVEAAQTEASFPAARCGVHWGTALYREGDYLGAAVNLAARLVATAERHQVLVSSAVRDRAIDLAGVEFRPRGIIPLKGVLEAPELFDVVRAQGEVPVRLHDLVCGMELAPSEVAARLRLGDEERVFSFPFGRAPQEQGRRVLARDARTERADRLAFLGGVAEESLSPRGGRCVRAAGFLTVEGKRPAIVGAGNGWQSRCHDGQERECDDEAMHDGTSFCAGSDAGGPGRLLLVTGNTFPARAGNTPGWVLGRVTFPRSKRIPSQQCG